MEPAWSARRPTTSDFCFFDHLWTQKRHRFIFHLYFPFFLHVHFTNSPPKTWPSLQASTRSFGTAFSFILVITCRDYYYYYRCFIFNERLKNQSAGRPTATPLQTHAVTHQFFYLFYYFFYHPLVITSGCFIHPRFFYVIYIYSV